MNNFKFRVFDKEKNKYVTEDEYFYLNLDGDLLWSKWKNENLIECNPDRFVVEQFTGLQDKNGVDIYDGDILKSLKFDRPYSTKQKSKECFGVVYFGSHGWSTDHYDENFSHWFGGLEQGEIVGNKHQNLELLGVGYEH